MLGLGRDIRSRYRNCFLNDELTSRLIKHDNIIKTITNDRILFDCRINCTYVNILYYIDPVQLKVILIESRRENMSRILESRHAHVIIIHSSYICSIPE